MNKTVLSVRQLNEAIQAALQATFPEPVWVKGEVQRLPHDAARRKHVYFELHDGQGQGAAKYQIPAALLGWDRDRFGLGKYIDGSDPAFRLQDKLEVCLLCRVDFYPPFGKISLKVVGIDPEFSLGQLEAQRRRTLAWLEENGLLELNKTRPVSELPLRVGLITSAGSAAEKDFRTSLTDSGYPFHVELSDCRMQGEQVTTQVSAALNHLSSRDLDIIVITRGGGSRADLSWFDQQDLCAAVARCELPVIAAIGHEIDTSLADLCAHTRCKTPTAAGEWLVDRIEVQDQRLTSATEAFHTAVLDRLDQAADALTVSERLAKATLHTLDASDKNLRTLGTLLSARTGRAVDRGQHRLQGAAWRLASGVRQRTQAARRQTDYLARRLSHETPRATAAGGRRLDRAIALLAPRARNLARERTTHLDLLEEKVRLLDPRRLLERGFTLTLDEAGKRVARAADTHPGQKLRTRFQDSEITSIVSEGGGKARPKPKTKPKKKPKGGGSGGEEDPGQQALF